MHPNKKKTLKKTHTHTHYLTEPPAKHAGPVGFLREKPRSSGHMWGVTGTTTSLATLCTRQSLHYVSMGTKFSLSSFPSPRDKSLQDQPAFQIASVKGTPQIVVYWRVIRRLWRMTKSILIGIRKKCYFEN